MTKRKKTTSEGPGDDPMNRTKEEPLRAAAESPGTASTPEVPDAPAGHEDSEPIVLNAIITIAEAAALKDQLLAHINRKGEVTIDGAHVESVDTAGLQVLLAFVRTLQGHGAVIRWTGISSALLNTARLLGLEQQIGLQA